MSDDGWYAAFAPRLWADCNLLSARWVLGEGGGKSVTESFVGLGIVRFNLRTEA